MQPRDVTILGFQSFAGWWNVGPVLDHAALHVVSAGVHVALAGKCVVFHDQPEQLACLRVCRKCIIDRRGHRRVTKVEMAEPLQMRTPCEALHISARQSYMAE